MGEEEAARVAREEEAAVSAQQGSRDEEQRHELVEAAVTAEKKNEEEEEAFRVETAAAAKLIDERAAEQIKAMRMEIIFVYISDRERWIDTYIHAYTYTYIHTYMHTHTNTHIHTHAHTHTKQIMAEREEECQLQEEVEADMHRANASVGNLFINAVNGTESVTAADALPPPNSSIQSSIPWIPALTAILFPTNFVWRPQVLSGGTLAMIDPTVEPSRVLTAPASTMKKPACSKGSLSWMDLASCRVEHTCTCGWVSRGGLRSIRMDWWTKVSGSPGFLLTYRVCICVTNHKLMKLAITQERCDTS